MEDRNYFSDLLPNKYRRDIWQTLALYRTSQICIKILLVAGNVINLAIIMKTQP